MTLPTLRSSKTESIESKSTATASRLPHGVGQWHVEQVTVFFLVACQALLTLQVLPMSGGVPVVFLSLVFAYLLPGYLFLAFFSATATLRWSEKVVYSLVGSHILALIVGVTAMEMNLNIAIFARMWLALNVILAIPYSYRGWKRVWAGRPSAPVSGTSNGSMARTERHRRYVSILLGCLVIAAVAGTTLLAAQAPRSADDPNVLAYIRQRLESDRFPDYEPYLQLPDREHLLRRRIDVLPLWEAYAYWLARADLVVAHRVYLPAFLLLLSILAFYELACTILKNRRLAQVAVLWQLLYFLSDALPDGAGYNLFVRLSDDKMFAQFALLPVVLATLVKAMGVGESSPSDKRRRFYLLFYWLSVLSVSFATPMGVVWSALATGAWGAFHLLVARRRVPLWRLAILLPPLMLATSLMLYGRLTLDTSAVQDTPYYDEGGDLNRSSLDRRLTVNADRLLLAGSFYIASPGLISHPLIVVSLLALPLLVPYLRRDTGAQFLFSTTLATLLLMYNPLLTPLLGRVITPWMLWRVAWLLYPVLIVAYVYQKKVLVPALAARAGRPAPGSGARHKTFWSVTAPLLALLVAAWLMRGRIHDSWQVLRQPQNTEVFATVSAFLGDTAGTIEPGSVVLAPEPVNNLLASFLNEVGVVERRGSPSFPERLLDVRTFFASWEPVESRIEVVHKYGAGYVIAETGSEAASLLHSIPSLFSLEYAGWGYELYSVSRGLWDNPATPYLIAGDVALADEDLDEALRQFLEAGAHSADLPLVHIRLGDTYLTMETWPEAVTAYGQALAIDPASAPAHAGLGQAYRAQGLVAEAVDHYQQAYALGDVTVHRQLLFAQGDLYQAQDKFDKALVTYRQALEEDTASEADEQLEVDALDLAADHAVHYLFEDLRLGNALAVSDASLIKPGVVILGGEAERVIGQHPSSSLSYSIAVGTGDRLKFRFALSPEVWKLGLGDGVEFKIQLQDAGGTSYDVFDRYIDPKNVSGDRRWYDQSLDLGSWAGQTVTLTLSTAPGPNGDVRFDWAIWGEPRITRPVAYDFYAELPGAEKGGARAESVRQAVSTLDLETRAAVVQPPGSRIVYANVALPEQARLCLGVALEPSAESLDARPAARYRVYLRSPEQPETWHLVYDRLVDPQHNEADRHWLDEEIELGTFGGQVVDVIFEIAPASAGGAGSYTTVWSRPIVVGGPF